MLEHLNPGSSAITGPVFVIGAGGFVGGAVQQRLAAAGTAVVALTRNEVDLLAPDAGERLTRLLFKGGAVVVVAAKVPSKTTALFLDNVRMIAAVGQALAAVPPAHVVYISSDAVYADHAGHDSLLTEADPADPGSLHGLTHRAREQLLREALAAVPLAVLRPSLLYGAADPHNGYGPNRFRRLAQAGQPIPLFGEGEEERDHVLIDDVAELVVRCLTARSRGVLNIATGTSTSFRAVAEQVVALAPAAVPILGQPRANPVILHRRFDPAATLAAWPDFRYTPLAVGLARVAGASGAGG